MRHWFWKSTACDDTQFTPALRRWPATGTQSARTASDSRGTSGTSWPSYGPERKVARRTAALTRRVERGVQRVGPVDFERLPAGSGRSSRWHRRRCAPRSDRSRSRSSGCRGTGAPRPCRPRTPSGCRLPCRGGLRLQRRAGRREVELVDVGQPVAVADARVTRPSRRWRSGGSAPSSHAFWRSSSAVPPLSLRILSVRPPSDRRVPVENSTSSLA